MILRLVLVLLCSVLWPGAAAAQAPAASDGRQRLALVVGIGTVGGREVLPSALRDASAVAAALSAGGYEVLLRQNTSSADLRAAFMQFRAQLKPDGLGLVYLTGPMAQVDGRGICAHPSAAVAALRSALDLIGEDR